MATTVIGTLFEAWKKRALLSEELYHLGQTTAPGRNQRLAVYMGDNMILTQTRYGHKMFVDSRDMSLSPHLIVDGDWEPWIGKAIATHVAPNSTVVEVGANFGFYTLLFAQWIGQGGRLFSFDANPRVFSLLKKNIEINGFIDTVECYNSLITDKVGQADFHILRSHMGSSSMHDQSEMAGIDSDSVETVSLPTSTLDEMLRDVPHIDFLKIDAEGAEQMILRGAEAILERSPNIKMVLEFDPYIGFESPESAISYLTSLKKMGFQMKFITKKSTLEDVSIDEIMKRGHAELMVGRNI